MQNRGHAGEFMGGFRWGEGVCYGWGNTCVMGGKALIFRKYCTFLHRNLTIQMRCLKMEAAIAEVTARPISIESNSDPTPKNDRLIAAVFWVDLSSTLPIRSKFLCSF